MKLSEIINKYRTDRDLTVAELAKRCNLSKAYISMLENDFKQQGRTKSITPSINAIKKLSVGMGIDFDTLLAAVDGEVFLNDDEDMYRASGIDFIRIPLYSPISCGTGAFVDDDIIEYIPVPSKGLSDPDNYFCQIAEGDSMLDAGIASGDLLVFEKMDVVESGTIGCFCVDDNIATCKKYIRSGDMIMLQPMNSAYQPIIIDPLYSHFKCLGKLKKAIKDFERE